MSENIPKAKANRTGGNRPKREQSGDGNSSTLEDFFARAEAFFDCVICGEKVKHGLRRTHESKCRMRPDDDDVIFVEEIKMTQQNEEIDEPAGNESISLKPPVKRRYSGGSSTQADVEDMEAVPEIVAEVPGASATQDQPPPKKRRGRKSKLLTEASTQHVRPVFDADTKLWSQRLRTRQPVDYTCKADSLPEDHFANVSVLKCSVKVSTQAVVEEMETEDDGQPTLNATQPPPKKRGRKPKVLAGSSTQPASTKIAVLTTQRQSDAPTPAMARADVTFNPDAVIASTPLREPPAQLELSDAASFNGSLDLFMESTTDDEADAAPVPEPVVIGLPVITNVRSLKVEPQQESVHSSDENGRAEAAPSKADSANEIDASQTQRQTGTPFLVKAFTAILERVCGDHFHAHLFNEEDKKLIAEYTSLPDDAKQLFCRLMSRKQAWLPLESLKEKYDGKLGVAEALEVLTRRKLLDCITGSQVDLKEILDTMKSAQLQALAKTFLGIKGSQGTKDHIVAALITYSRSQITLGGSTTDILIKRAKQAIGESYRIRKDAYFLFVCIFHIFSPKEMASSNLDDQNNKSVKDLINVVINILRQKSNEGLKFVKTGVRDTHQFRSRMELKRYVEANMSEVEMFNAFTKKRHEDCDALRQAAFEQLHGLLESDAHEYDALPSYLRKYSAPRVLFRILNYGLQSLEQQKRYPEAVDRLREMIHLAQADWCPVHRSRWYERLALDLEKHLKDPDEALIVIEKALDDESVTEDIRINLFDRAKKILESQISKIKSEREKVALQNRLARLRRENSDLTLHERTIDATLLTKSVGGRQKTIFATRNADDGSVTARNVEAVAQLYYKEHFGFTEGLHGEGSPWMTLFGLFLWDIINDSEVPDAFICSQQWEPLDLNDAHFYGRRKDKIEERLEWIRSTPSEVLMESLRGVWERHHGEATSLVSWDLFKDIEQIDRVVTCIGGQILAGVFRRLVTNLNSRSGFPDLLLWNYAKKTFKVVEVKGPGDRLSPKQRLWLDFFVRIDAPAEVCWVKGVSGKAITGINGSA